VESEDPGIDVVGLAEEVQVLQPGGRHEAALVAVDVRVEIEVGLILRRDPGVVVSLAVRREVLFFGLFVLFFFFLCFFFWVFFFLFTTTNNNYQRIFSR